MKRFLLFSGGIVAFLVILLILAGLLVSPLADSSIRKILAGKPLPGHTIDFRKVNVNLATFSAAIKDLTITPDSMLYSETSPDSLARLPLIELSVDRISLRELKVFRLIFKKQLVVNSFSIRSPEIRYTTPRMKQSLVATTEPDTLVDNKGQVDLRAFGLHSIEITDGNFYLSRWGQEPYLFSDNYNLLITGITARVDDHFSPADDLVFEQGEAVLKDNRFLLPGDLYTLSAGTIRINYSDSLLIVEDFRLEPNYPPGEFGWKYGSQTDRFDIAIDTLAATDIHFGDLMGHNRAGIGKLEVRGAAIGIHRDKNVPFDRSKFPRLPHQSITSLDIPMMLDTVEITGASITYAELGEGKDEPGVISLEEVRLRITNITNFEEAVERNEKILAEGTFLLQGEGLLSLTLELPLAQKRGEFIYSGKAGPMPLSVLSSMTGPAENILITGGMLDELEFRMEGNEETASGTVRFYYHDLEIEFLKKKHDDDGEQKISRLITDLANIALRQHNPQDGKPGKVALAYFERDRNKGIVNLMVKPLLQGMLTTAKPGNKHAYDEGDENDRKKKMIKMVEDNEKEKRKKQGRN